MLHSLRHNASWKCKIVRTGRLGEFGGVLLDVGRRFYFEEGRPSYFFKTKFRRNALVNIRHAEFPEHWVSRLAGDGCISFFIAMDFIMWKHNLRGVSCVH
jgi:hypothetical protein